MKECNTMTHWLKNGAKDCGLCDPPMNGKLAITMLKKLPFRRKLVCCDA